MRVSIIFMLFSSILFSQATAQPPPVEPPPQIAYLCYTTKAIKACSLGGEEFCSDQPCAMFIVDWEDIEVNGYTVQRPVFEYACADGTTGVTEHNPNELYESCEVSDDTVPQSRRYEDNPLKEIRPLCYYYIECASCNTSPGSRWENNRKKEGVTYPEVFDAGKSRYDLKSCGEHRSINDLPQFASIRECVSDKGACTTTQTSP
jgi:hypothetical protein